MFVLFKSALSSRPLYVNPLLVRTVVDGDQMGQVKICVDDQHTRHSSRYGGGSGREVGGHVGVDH